MSTPSPPTTRTLWRHRDFLRLWSAQAVSAFGARISREGLPLAAVLALKAPPAQLGVLAALSLAPGLVVGLTAGGFVDRSRRRTLMIAADLARAGVLLTVPFAAWFGLLTMAQLYIAAVLVGAASVLFEIADQAYLPTLVSHEGLLDANAKLSITNATAEVAGPALAGVLIQLLRAPMALAANAVTYLVSAAFLATIENREPPARAAAPEEHVLADLKAGARAVFADPHLRPLLMTAATSSLFGGFFWALYVLFAIRALGLTPMLLGLTVAFGGISALFGAVFGPRLIRRLGIGPAYLLAALLAAASALLIPLAHGRPLEAMGFLILAQFLGDGLGVTADMAATTLRQSLTAPRMLGRVGAVFQAAPGGLAVIGALAGGALAEAIGMRAALTIAAAGIVAAPLWCLFSPLARLRALPAPAAAS